MIELYQPLTDEHEDKKDYQNRWIIHCAITISRLHELQPLAQRLYFSSEDSASQRLIYSRLDLNVSHYNINYLIVSYLSRQLDSTDQHIFFRGRFQKPFRTQEELDSCLYCQHRNLHPGKYTQLPNAGKTNVV